MATLTQELQAKLPRARVLYCSATGVSEVSSLSLNPQSRLGPSLPFSPLSSLFLPRPPHTLVPSIPLFPNAPCAVNTIKITGTALDHTEPCALPIKGCSVQCNRLDHLRALWRA